MSITKKAEPPKQASAISASPARARARRRGRSHRPEATRKAQDAFLAAFAMDGTVTHAAEAAHIDRDTHYLWMRKPEYAARFATAQEKAFDALEKEARRRAHDGILEPVYYKGEVCGAIKRYSDNLLIFLLKAARPEKYRERYDVAVRHATDEELKQMIMAMGYELITDGETK